MTVTSFAHLSSQHTAAFLDLTMSRLCTSMNLAQYKMCVKASRNPSCA